MIKPLLFNIFLLLCISTVTAQELESEPEQMEDSEEYTKVQEWELIQDRANINSMPKLGANASLLNSSLSFQFSFLRYNNRALPYTTKSYFINGMELNSLSDNRVPYSAIGSLYRLPGSSITSYSADFSAGFPNYALNSSHYHVIEPQLSYNNGYLYSSITSRTYAFKHAAGYNLKTNNQWDITIDATRNWGNSLSVDGVWSDNFGLTFSASKKLGSSPKSGTLNFTALLNSTERAVSKSITEEAAELSSNQLYNPAWGVQDGRQRSVNTRGGFEPILLLSYSKELSNDLKLEIGAATRFGKSYYSALSWQSAPNPTPDYYRYMPSYQDSQEAVELTQWMWQNDINTSQINFEQLYQTNQTSLDGRAYYIIEHRVNEPLFLSTSGRLGGENFSIGFTAAYQYERFYKELSSLLGADYWLDLDSFVEQDEDVKDLTQNNLREPNRRIYEGDEFGYNYSMTNFKFSLDGVYTKRWGDLSVSAATKVDMLTFQREGYYEKENFPTGNSFGASEAVVGFDYLLKLQGEYNLGSKFSAHLVAGYTSLSPRVDELFLVPEYRNAVTPGAQNSSILSGEVGVKYNTVSMKVGANLYGHSQQNDMDVRGMYDDLMNCYLDYVVSGVSSTRVGLEVWGEFLVAEPLWLSFVGIWQSNVYSGNAQGVGYKNSTGVEVVESEVLYYDGRHLGGSPEKMAAVSLSYRPYGWSVSGSVIVFDGVYESLTPFRYSQRFLDRASDEVGGAAGMMEQGKSKWGLSLDLSGGYTFRFDGGGSFGVYCGVSNLLNNTSICSGSYQSNRFYEDGWKITPQASKGYYALGVNGYLSLVFRF